MNVAIRVDSSHVIGTGHLMRCLTLAGEMRRRGADVLFVCRAHPGDAYGLARTAGFAVEILPAAYSEETLPGDLTHSSWLGSSQEVDAEATCAKLQAKHFTLLIVDHYALDYRWQRRVHPYVDKMMVIDDLADRRHACDVLLDQNHYPGLATRYDALVPSTCQKFLGPQYALLRREFFEWRAQVSPRPGSVRRVFVCFGGGDPFNLTMRALSALASLKIKLDVVTVIGASHPHREQIANFSSVHGWELNVQSNQVAELMAKCDLALGASGSISWERCAVGLPSIVVTFAENQVAVAEGLAAAGAACYLGVQEAVSTEDIAHSVARLMGHPDEVSRMSRQAMGLIVETGRSGMDRLLSGLGFADEDVG